MMPSFVISRRRAFACILLLQGMWTACADADASVRRDDRPPGLERKPPVSPNWTTGMSIGGVEDDSTLMIIGGILANDAGVYVADIAAKRIAHFNHDGTMIWTYGREGSGPDEFRDPRDIRLDAHGRVWVLDSRNSRIVILEPTGVVHRRIPLGELPASPFEIIPQPHDGAIVVVHNPVAPFMEIDSTGALVAQRAFPWPDFQELHPLATQLLTVTDPASDQWVTAFRMGDGLFGFAGSRPHGKGWFAEEIAFPMPVTTRGDGVTSTSFNERPVSAARSLTLSPEHLYVLFGGSTEHHRRLVDVYSRTDLSYKSSFLLPEPAINITWYHGGLYALQENPYPELVHITPIGMELR
jgi:hypothetical protein